MRHRAIISTENVLLKRAFPYFKHIHVLLPLGYRGDILNILVY